MRATTFQKVQPSFFYYSMRQFFTAGDIILYAMSVKFDKQPNRLAERWRQRLLSPGHAQKWLSAGWLALELELKSKLELKLEWGRRSNHRLLKRPVIYSELQASRVRCPAKYWICAIVCWPQPTTDSLLVFAVC